MHIKKSTLILIIVASVAAIIIAGLLLTKSLGVEKLASNVSRSSLGFSDSYSEVATHCPTNIELQEVCIKKYYSEESVVDIEKALVQNFKRNAYEHIKLNKGYDGPNQIAYSAYNSVDDVSLIVVIVNTDNVAYKKANGNIRAQAYAGATKYNNYR